MVGQQTLDLLILVRIQAWELFYILENSMYYYIIDRRGRLEWFC